MFVTRPAIAGDARAVRPLLEALIREQFTRYPAAYPRLEPHATAAAWVDRWRRRLEAADPDVYVWLACDRAAVGMLAGEVWARVAGEPSRAFFAEWFYVVPEHRHSGVGVALERELLTTCRARGVTHVEARSVAGDTQWLDRGWATTSVYVVRPLEALAADLTRANVRRAVA